MYSRAIHTSRTRRRRAEKRLERLSLLKSPIMDVLGAIPPKLIALRGSVSALRPPDASVVAALTQFQLADPGKRQWETSKTGYLNWAVGQLLAKAREDGIAGEGSSAVDILNASVGEVGQADQLRVAFEVMEGVQPDLETVSALRDQMEE
jgi:kinetochore protein Mis12/MTW1